MCKMCVCQFLYLNRCVLFPEVSFTTATVSPTGIWIMLHQVPADFNIHSPLVRIVIDCCDTSKLVKETDVDHSKLGHTNFDLSYGSGIVLLSWKAVGKPAGIHIYVVDLQFVHIETCMNWHLWKDLSVQGYFHLHHRNCLHNIVVLSFVSIFKR